MMDRVLRAKKMSLTTMMTRAKRKKKKNRRLLRTMNHRKIRIRSLPLQMKEGRSEREVA